MGGWDVPGRRSLIHLVRAGVVGGGDKANRVGGWVGGWATTSPQALPLLLLLLLHTERGGWVGRWVVGRAYQVVEVQDALSVQVALVEGIQTASPLFFFRLAEGG